MLEQFVSSIFRHCPKDGWVKHYVFEHGGKDTKPRRSEWGRLSDSAKMHDFIEWSRQRPGTVYCPPVALFTDPTASTGEANVAECPALVVELDDNPTEMRGLAEAILGPATLVVRSGGVTPDGEDKLHLYWRLTRPARTAEERQVLKAAREALGTLCEADMTAAPLMHPMRWPGSWHTKGEPRLCEIIESTENELDLDAAYAVLNEVAPTPVKPVRTDRQGQYKTPVPLGPDEVARLLSKIPNTDLSWDQWNRLGMTVWDASHGSDEGRKAWHEWSAQDARYDADVTDARWDHYFDSPPGELSAGTLYHQAGERPAPEPGVAFASVPEITGITVLPEPPITTAKRKAGFGARSGGTNGIMFEDQQVDHFKDCVYVTSLDKVLMPNGSLLSQSKFDVRRGGYHFMVDPLGKTTTKSAWEAFLKNPLYTPPIADDMCFRPETASFELVEEGNWILVNAYVPVDTPKTEGDPAKFLDWLSRALPVERDRQILLSYCAAIVQNLGRKAQWWPVIIGTKGNGKTLLLSAMAFAHGYQYTHLPNTSKMTRNGINFNGWMRNKLFLGLEEIYSAGRRDFLEEFKPYVTNRRLPIEAKGEDEYTGDNRANGIMLTNHLDGVPIDPDERRYAPFITKQETEEDCIRDGLTSAYFSDMWDWMDGKGAYEQYGPEYGYRVINHYLHRYVPVPEFDPFQLATRRPKTSCFARAVEAGRGGVEQEVLAAIEEGRIGFAGGWVSGKYLDDLIEKSRIRVPRNKRRDLMKSIGYDWHPALDDGRPTSSVQPDGMRSKLYVHSNSPLTKLTDVGEITRRYAEAQINAQLGP